MGGVFSNSPAAKTRQALTDDVMAPKESSSLDRFQQYAQLQPAAESKDLGDYFEYNLKQSITIGKNQSALVPILQSRIEAEKVTLWSASGLQRALRALWIKNASGQTSIPAHSTSLIVEHLPARD